MNLEELDEETFKAIKRLVKGFCLKEVVEEYSADANGEMKLSKQKISKKVVPPNTDILKMLFNKSETPVTSFEDWSDADLEKEKQRLLKILKKGENNEYRANESKNQM
ncbi:MAG: hypothetical protein IJA72_00150 [Clostridia bacterium]|nr:hypothetical protein [Clostridia bacterium]